MRPQGKLATLRGTDAAAGEPEMEQMNLGLYAYPVLQAADILLYRHV
jgi:tryptophanyl-tRNA synthetase